MTLTKFSRRKFRGIEVPLIKKYAHEIYSEGYKASNNPGNQDIAGGGEQPLTINSVKNFFNKLVTYRMDRGLKDKEFKILWIGAGCGEEAILTSLFFKNRGEKTKIIAYEISE